MSWTPEQVIALAPDPSAAKAGRELGTERSWLSLGQSEAALWGECRGSAAQPYRTQIDLSEPAFKCSCPSRKFPCKHSLGLFLIYAARPASLAVGPTPDWVQAWLVSRAERTKKAETASKRQPLETDPEAAAAQAAKRTERRLSRAAEGVDELALWLDDLLKEGLAELPRRPQTFWSQIAARMVDAQVPGLARQVSELGRIPSSGPGWPERMLARMGRLQLLMEGSRRLAELEAGLQAEVRATLGFTESKDNVAATGDVVTDQWLVVGRVLNLEDRLKVQRTWLRGASSRRACLVLDFAAGGQSLDQSLIPGTRFEGAVRFYAGSRPLRGLVASRRSDPEPLDRFKGDESVESALGVFAELLAANPFLERGPISLESVQPLQNADGWFVIDSQGTAMRLAGGPACWRVLAMSGGRPLGVFGEWDGRRLTLVGAMADGQFANLQWLKP